MKFMTENVSFKLIVFFILSSFWSCATGNEIVKPTPKPNDSTKIVASEVAFWLTDPNNTTTLLKRQNVALNFTNKVNSNATILVDSTVQYQTMDGFGFAMTGGSAYLINRLPTNDYGNLLHELFSNDSNSIGISYLRISIGSSDLNSYVFSYDDINPLGIDTTLQFFSIKPDTYDLIPVLKSVIGINPKIKILACPWSAPAWMKTNNSPKGGSLKPEYFATYARYFVKYIQAMKEQGITIDAITPQNEPLNPDNNPSMFMSATDEALFVKGYLGPEFQKANITTKIIVFDHNCDLYSYPLTILNDNQASAFCDGSAFHLYGGDISALSVVYNAHPDKNVYFTEQWVGAPGNFPEDLKWHVKNLIIGAPRNWSKNVIEWNLASDPSYNPHTIGGCGSCLGGITIGNTITRNVGYYIVAHASKFVPAGSVRIDSGLQPGLPNVAFLTPEGKKILIVLNENSNSQTFNIQFNGKIVSPTLNSGAVGTFVW